MAVGLPLLAAALLAGCNSSPYPVGAEKTNTLFTAFQERSPKYLDPTASYSLNEVPYLYSMYEPLYAYHYLKRPYTLVPKVATEVVAPRLLDKDGKLLPADAPAEQVAESVYNVPIKRGILFAPHPAFAKDAQGHYLYHALTPAQIASKHSPWDFEQTGTRELVADDFVYAFKRQATTRIEAPIFGIFSEYVIGLKEYSELIRREDAKLRQGLAAAALDKPFLDFRKYPLEGVSALDAHTLRIRIKGRYPQWKYWLAMTFTAPVPWEADLFYAQVGMAANGLSLNTWPVGAGAFMMTESLQDRRHVLVRNPNYRGTPYPCEGSDADKAAGLLDDCGKMTPFVDRIVFNIEKEKVPMKSKFQQGYLDTPEIERPDWGPEFLADIKDADEVQRRFQERGMQFPVSVEPTNWYLGFNWLDPVVGKGDTPERQVRNRKLRQALSIAIDWEEGYGRVFVNKAGEAAHSPLPGGVFGSRHGTVEGHDPVTHKVVNGQVVRRSIDEAKKLLADAGYPDGRDAKSGRPLVLNYDYQRTPTPEIKAELDWMVKQFAKLGVQLEVRATDYNQFQDKMLRGQQQIFWWGWFADYPDPENFMFLLYGPNYKAKPEGGENAANYQNPEYDKLYRQMASMENGPERQAIIDKMVAIVQEDAPWAFGYFPYAGGAYQQWLHNGKFGLFAYDRQQFFRIDPAQRAERLAAWNRPIWWPLALIVLALLVLAWRLRSGFRARERATGRGLPGQPEPAPAAAAAGS